MLVTDETYIKAKKVKNNEAELALEFKLLNEFLVRQYSANLLSADIHYEPIFKDLGPKLRLIIDSSVENSNLPIYYRDRYVISKKFLEIIKELNVDYNLDITYDKLNIEYVSYDEMYYEETINSLSYNDILDSINDPLIIKYLQFFSEFVFLYKDLEILQNKKSEGFDKKIRQIIVDKIERKGYKGQHLKEVEVKFDVLESLDKAGGEYYYWR